MPYHSEPIKAAMESFSLSRILGEMHCGVTQDCIEKSVQEKTHFENNDMTDA